MADIADEIAMEGFFSYFDVFKKKDGTPVTSVDRRIEMCLRDLVQATDAYAGFLGEEFPPTVGLGRWVVDPIDGTAQFVDGSPRFATLIAYEIDDTPIVGVVSAPALGMRWWASQGGGARLSFSGEVSAARVSSHADPTSARVLVPRSRQVASPGRRVLADLTEARGTFHPCGASWEAVAVADGRADAAVAEGKWWDVAPLAVIVKEAGGVASRYRADDGRVGIATSNRVLARRAAGVNIGV
jgi:histidinol-phosphatase